MKIVINEIKETNEEYVLFHVHEVDEKINKMIQHIKNTDTHLIGKQDEKLYKVKYKDIFYIETVDKKSFMYTTNHVLSLSEKLYQLEERLQWVDFFRVSKSMLLNLDKIEQIYPTVSARFEAKLTNGEVVIIARSYVQKLKKKMGIGR